MANAVSGTGAVTQTGTGTTILTGTNTYTGGTTISNGTLQIGDGGTTGSIVGNVSATSGEVLAFNRVRCDYLYRSAQRRREPAADRHGHDGL